MSRQTKTTLPHSPFLFGPDDSEAAGQLASLYRETEKVFGYLPNVARLYGISPSLLANQMRHIGFFSQHETLRPALLAFIRLLVSERVRCDYCIDLNAALLMRAGVSAEAIQAAREDADRAPLPARDKALLNFVLAAVADPQSVGEQEMEGVRAHGWSDQDIFEAVHHGAYAVATDVLLDTFKIQSD